MYFPRSEKYISMVSEPFGSMDTQFRNEVYVVLARHESTFVQIQNTLQTIRDEIQSLSFSQTQLSTYLPMFFDDTYVSAEVFIDFDKPPIFDELPKRAQFHPISLPTQFSTTNHITSTRAAASAAFKLHHTIHCISLTAVTTATRSFSDGDRLRKKSERPFLDSPMASCALKTTRNLRGAVVPLPVFDPGGSWVTFLQDVSKFHPCGQG